MVVVVMVLVDTHTGDTGGGGMSGVDGVWSSSSASTPAWLEQVLALGVCVVHSASCFVR